MLPSGTKKRAFRPKTIKLGPYKIALWFTKEKMKEARKKFKHPDTIGITDMSSSNIFIDPDLSKDIEAETVLHEVLHSIWYTVGLSETDFKEHEEQVVCSMSPLLLSVLRENPNLVKYLLEKH